MKSPADRRCLHDRNTDMKNTVFIFLFFFLSAKLAAQTDSLWPKRSLHIELGGSGGIWSVSTERSLGRQGWILQFGYSFVPTGKLYISTLPILIKKTFGEKEHKLEAGVGQGLSLAFGDGVKFFPRGILEIGWRYQKTNSRWIFRAMYTPLISYIVDLQYQHWAGIGIGYQIQNFK